MESRSHVMSLFLQLKNGTNYELDIKINFK